MLFNSLEFIFVYLPLTMVLFWVARRVSVRAGMCALVLASLAFYAWWNPKYLLLLVGSVAFNFLVAKQIAKTGQEEATRALSRILFGMGVGGNLFVLGYYKYAGFVVENINWVAGTDWTLGNIILPLAISFFTFQQIGYLVDTLREKQCSDTFLDYALFVCFFPQLIAGPIVHHAEVFPQFRRENRFQINARDVIIGLTIFSMGLFKKTVLADTVAKFATPVFDMALVTSEISFAEAWSAVIAYSLQIYFDFSGYSDMAIGLARIFSIRLPVNFHSPYKARNIAVFWQRWHITLTRFINVYLYNPIALYCNRLALEKNFSRLLSFAVAVAFPNAITFLVVGAWHGAGWQFLLFGAAHAFYLIVAYGWKEFVPRKTRKHLTKTRWGYIFSRTLTCLSVALSFVLFRAETLESSGRIFVALFNGTQWLPSEGLVPAHWPGVSGFLLMTILTWIVWNFPNTQEIMVRYQPTLNLEQFKLQVLKVRLFEWRMKPLHAFGVAIVFAIGVAGIHRTNEFLYFQF